jgi:hypothetical protein
MKRILLRVIITLFFIFLFDVNSAYALTTGTCSVEKSLDQGCAVIKDNCVSPYDFPLSDDTCSSCTCSRSYSYSVNLTPSCVDQQAKLSASWNIENKPDLDSQTSCHVWISDTNNKTIKEWNLCKQTVTIDPIPFGDYEIHINNNDPNGNAYNYPGTVAPKNYLAHVDCQPTSIQQQTTEKQSFNTESSSINSSCGIDGVATLDCIPVVINYLISGGLRFIGIVVLFLIIYAGIKLIMSGGDIKQLELTRKTIVYAIIGAIVVLLSFFIINMISAVTGVALF